MAIKAKELNNLDEPKVSAMFHAASMLTILLAFFLSGCANAEVRPIETTDKMGIRFYRPWPYLMIANSTQHGCTMTIINLPDRSQEYIIVPHTGIGSISVAATLSDGWNLTGLNTTADSKTAEILTAMSALAGAIKPAAMAEGEEPSAQGQPKNKIGPGLYRLEFDATGSIKPELKEVFHLQDATGKRLNCVK